MNKRIKRLSKPVLAFVLTLTLLMSCLTAGMAVTSAEDAAAPLAEQKADAAPQSVNTVTQPAPAPQTAPVPAAPASTEKADAPVAAPAAEQPAQANTPAQENTPAQANTPAQDSAPAQEPVFTVDVQQDTAQAEQPAVSSKDDEAPVGASDDSEEVGYSTYNSDDDPDFSAAENAGKAFIITYTVLLDNDYTVYGAFDDSDIGVYIEETGDEYEPYRFISDDAKARFLTNCLPFIDFEGQRVLWDFKGASYWYDDTTYIKVCGEVVNSPLNISFDLPYEHNGFDPVVTDGKVNKADSEKVNVPSPVYLGDTYNVQAPDVIYNGSTPYYFNYWSVTTEPIAANKHEAIEYTRGFNKNFDLVFYTHSVVTPVYKTTRPSGEDDQGITIFHVNTTRKDVDMYNGVYETAASLDFLISFNNVLGGVQLNKIDWTLEDVCKYAYEHNYQIPEIAQQFGAVCTPYLYIEKVAGSNIEADGGTKTDAQYKQQYGNGFADLDKIALDDFYPSEYVNSFATPLSLNNKNRVSFVFQAGAGNDQYKTDDPFSIMENRGCMINYIDSNKVYRAAAVLYQVKITQLPTKEQLQQKGFNVSSAEDYARVIDKLLSDYNNPQYRQETIDEYGFNCEIIKQTSDLTYFTVYDVININQGGN